MIDAGSLYITLVVPQDLKNAKAIVDWIAWAEPQYDFNPMIDEWCREAPKELDFNQEAGMCVPLANFKKDFSFLHDILLFSNIVENTRTVAKNLCCNGVDDNTDHGNRVNVLIPEVILVGSAILLNDSIIMHNDLSHCFNSTLIFFVLTYHASHLRRS